MKIDRLSIEDWLISASGMKYNFSESGVPDFDLGCFLEITKTDIASLGGINLGNNDTRGSEGLRRKISRTYKIVSPDNVLVTTGTSEALYIFFNLFLRRRSRVMLLFPAFPPLYLVPQALGAGIKYFDILDYRDKNEMLEMLLIAIKRERPDLLIINVPHNPTGVSFSVEQIRRIGKAAKEVRCAILADEHYRFLPAGPGCAVMPSAYDIISAFYRNIFAVGSLIKCAGIVGIRVGWLIGSAGFLNKVRGYKDYTTHCVSLINEHIAGLALQNIDKFAGSFTGVIRGNWQELLAHRTVKEGKIILNYDLGGGCVCFPQLKGGHDFRVACQLAARFNTSVLPGRFFNKQGYIRINLSRDRRIFRRLLDNIGTILR